MSLDRIQEGDQMTQMNELRALMEIQFDKSCAEEEINNFHSLYDIEIFIMRSLKWKLAFATPSDLLEIILIKLKYEFITIPKDINANKWQNLNEIHQQSDSVKEKTIEIIEFSLIENPFYTYNCFEIFTSCFQNALKLLNLKTPYESLDFYFTRIPIPCKDRIKELRVQLGIRLSLRISSGQTDRQGSRYPSTIIETENDNSSSGRDSKNNYSNENWNYSLYPSKRFKKSKESWEVQERYSIFDPNNLNKEDIGIDSENPFIANPFGPKCPEVMGGEEENLLEEDFNQENLHKSIPNTSIQPKLSLPNPLLMEELAEKEGRLRHNQRPIIHSQTVISWTEDESGIFDESMMERQNVRRLQTFSNKMMPEEPNKSPSSSMICTETNLNLNIRGENGVGRNKDWLDPNIGNYSFSFCGVKPSRNDNEASTSIGSSIGTSISAHPHKSKLKYLKTPDSKTLVPKLNLCRLGNKKLDSLGDSISVNSSGSRSGNGKRSSPEMNTGSFSGMTNFVLKNSHLRVGVSGDTVTKGQEINSAKLLPYRQHILCFGGDSSKKFLNEKKKGRRGSMREKNCTQSIGEDRGLNMGLEGSLRYKAQKVRQFLNKEQSAEISEFMEGPTMSLSSSLGFEHFYTKQKSEPVNVLINIPMETFESIGGVKVGAGVVIKSDNKNEFLCSKFTQQMGVQ